MIHKYKISGMNIVLDICSGAVHIADDIGFGLLDYTGENMGETCPEEAIKALPHTKKDTEEAYAELYELYKNGLLYSKDDYRQFEDRLTPSPVKAMCLNIAHDCNLRCEYCFAAKGDFGEGKALMSAQTGTKAIDWLIDNSGSRRNLEVDFFGGEPLMNWNAVKQTVDHARSKEKAYNKNFRFTLTTNGLLLDDEKIDYINREMSNVVLSLDGRPEINDKLRLTQARKGSYEIIVPKYKRLLEARKYKNYYVRGTFTKHNPDFTNDVLHLYNTGFDQISIEPVVSDPELDFSIKEDDIERVKIEYEHLAEEIIKLKKARKSINFFHFMIDLDQGPCAIKRLRGCSAGNEYIAVTPDGSIYPCHQFVGVKQYKMGSIHTGEFNKEMKQEFTDANIFNKPDCTDCWARFYCSGGCNANNSRYCGNMLKPHKISCELEKKRIECAIYIKASINYE